MNPFKKHWASRRNRPGLDHGIYSSPTTELATRYGNATEEFSKHLTSPSPHKNQAHVTSRVALFLQKCPADLIPKVLAFAGPQACTSLSKVNRHWKNIIDDESTWQTLCLEFNKVGRGSYPSACVECWSMGKQPFVLYRDCRLNSSSPNTVTTSLGCVVSHSHIKWRPGQEEDIPMSWKEYYGLHPCVPVDYRTIPDAVASARRWARRKILQQVCTRERSSSSPTNEHGAATMEPSKKPPCRFSVLVGPGAYSLYETVALEENETLLIRGMDHFVVESSFVSPDRMPDRTRIRPSTRSLVGRGGSPDLLHRLRQGLVDTTIADGDYYDDDESLELVSVNLKKPTGQAPRHTVVLQSSLSLLKKNKPLFRLTHGTLILQNVQLYHHTMGMDLLNGNCAIHVHSTTGSEPPRLSLTRCVVTSRTGRGIVVTGGQGAEGGIVDMYDSSIMNCAATGLYIGSYGTQATLENCDLVHNGTGCEGGIPAGHSGICLECGHVKVRNCNISWNTASGVFLIRSPLDERDNEDASIGESVSAMPILHLEDSDVMRNRLHPIHTQFTHTMYVENRNRISHEGFPRFRSSFRIVV